MTSHGLTKSACSEPDLISRCSNPNISNCQNGHPRRVLDPFAGCGYRFHRGSRLPSKQFAFSGDTITLELKFARNGIDNAMARLIRSDFQKMNRLFRILGDRGEGDSIFSYLVIFNRLDQPPCQTPLADFFRDHIEWCKTSDYLPQDFVL